MPILILGNYKEYLKYIKIWILLINIIRKIFFISLKTFLILAVFVALFVGWIYTGPRDVTFLTSYFEKSINDALPATAKFTLEKIELNIDEDNKIALKIYNSNIVDESKGDFNLEEMHATIDLLGFLPQSNHHLLNINISGPKIKFADILTAKDLSQNSNSLLPIEKINAYLNEYKDKIRRLSLSISNTNISFKNHLDKDVIINVNLLELEPIVKKGIITLAIYADLNIKNKNSVIESIISTNSNSHLNLSGTITNISTIMLEELGYEINELKNSHVEVDLNFEAKISNSQTLDFVKFDIGNFEGKINKNHFFPNDIMPQKFIISGVCHNNCKTLQIEDLTFEDEELKINSSFDLKTDEKSSTLKGTFNLGKIAVNNIQNYWPEPAVARTRAWIFENIANGFLKNASGKFNFNLDELSAKKNLSKEDLNIELDLENTSIKYMDSVPPITDLNAKVFVEGQDISFEVKSATLLKSTISNAKGSVIDLANKKSRVLVDANLDGPAQDLIDIAYMHADETNKKFKNITGNAKTHVEVVVPITSSKTSLIDIDINAQSIISNANMPGIYKDFDASNAQLKAVYKDHKTYIEGTATANGVASSNIKAELDFINNSQVINVESSLKWEDAQKFGYPKPDFVTGDLDANVQISDENGKITENIYLDLKKSKISINELQINKEIGSPSYLKINNATVSKNNNQSNYEIALGTLYSKGDIKFNNDDFEITYLNSSMTKLGDGKFTAIYNLNHHQGDLFISGDSLDLSMVGKSFAQDSSTTNSTFSKSTIDAMKVRTKVKTLYMKNKVHLYKPELSLDCNLKGCENIVLQGNYGNKKQLILRKNSKNLKLFSDDAGLTASGFGITNNLSSGSINIVGSYGTQDELIGNVQLTDFTLNNTPILSKILSLTSFTVSPFEGIKSFLSGGTVDFQNLTCPIIAKDKLITLNNCAAKGASLALTASGDIDLNKNRININGIMVPENIVNTVLKNVPVIKNAFGGSSKENEALGINFKIVGDADDPEVKTNPLSVLTPGIFRNLFK